MEVENISVWVEKHLINLNLSKTKKLVIKAE